jgi:LasA protease
MFGTGIARIVSAGVLAVSLTGGAHVPPQNSPQAPDLESAVQQSLTGGSGESSADPIVEARSYTEGDAWAFGSGVTLEHDEPRMTLFVAHEVAGDWEVALEGSSDFGTFAREAPDDVIPQAEGVALAEAQPAPDAPEDLDVATEPEPGGEPEADSESESDSEAIDPGLSLPWKTGDSWLFSGGAHTDTGDGDGVRNSLDFHGDGSVVAPRDGIVYKSCVSDTSALVKIVHDNGYSTTYYHMVDVTQLPDGSPIEAGTHLGRVGNELPCGGHTTGPHVHFSLLKGDDPVAVDGVELGGWVFHSGAEQYEGWAEREGDQVEDGEWLENFGTSEEDAATEKDPATENDIATEEDDPAEENAAADPDVG